jgi:cation:H+ antiporter
MALEEVLLFVLGLILLVKGSDFFVKSAASIAKKLGVSEFVIGLTLVALGTSIPELASSVIASLKQDSGIIIGNVVGSNIANIGLIIGLTASFMILKTKKEMLNRDGFIMLFAAFIFYLFAFNREITRIEAALFLLFYFGYILFLFEIKNKESDKYHFKAYIDYFFNFKYLIKIKSGVFSGLKNKKISLKKVKKLKNLFKAALARDFLILIISGTAIVIGAKYLVEESIFFANLLNIPSTLVGITLIAVGTSLPELSVSITAARKGYGNIVVGNIIGSNIANIFLIIGVSGLISPLSVIKQTIFYTAPFMVFMSILLLVFIRGNWRIKKIEGNIILVLYVLFIASLIFLNFSK